MSAKVLRPVLAGAPAGLRAVGVHRVEAALPAGMEPDSELAVKSFVVLFADEIAAEVASWRGRDTTDA